VHWLALVSLIWAYSFGLIGSALKGVDPYFVAAARLGCALLVFLPFLRLGKAGRVEAPRLVLYGAIQFGCMYVAYINAFRFLPSHLVALFSVLTPVYVVLIHDLRQRRFTPGYLLAAALSVLGAAVIEGEAPAANRSIWIGFALMQIAGIVFAFGQVAYRDWKHAHPQIRDREAFALLYLGGTVIALSFSASLTDWSELRPTAGQWQALAYLGLVASGLGFFLWNKGAALSSPGVLAAFNNAVVPLAVLCSLFVFKEIETIGTEGTVRLTIGGTLIAASVILGRKRISSLS